MLIITGSIRTAAADRDAFVAASVDAVRTAREAPGCLDFVVAADPLDSERVNVLERWERATDLDAFRGSGPGADLTSMIVAADVQQYEVTPSGPA
jgi:quinol monooxygenase YgiN